MEITDYAEYVEITEIYDIESRMEKLFKEWEFIFDVIKKNPEMVKKFRDGLK